MRSSRLRSWLVDLVEGLTPESDPDRPYHAVDSPFTIEGPNATWGMHRAFAVRVGGQARPYWGAGDQSYQRMRFERTLTISLLYVAGERSWDEAEDQAVDDANQIMRAVLKLSNNPAESTDGAFTEVTDCVHMGVDPTDDHGQVLQSMIDVTVMHRRDWS